MQRRNIPVRERLRILRTRKALALGFGVPLALLFLIPLVAVALMPGAVAGAALLVRGLTGEAEAERHEGAPKLTGPPPPQNPQPPQGPQTSYSPRTPPPGGSPQSPASYR